MEKLLRLFGFTKKGNPCHDSPERPIPWTLCFPPFGHTEASTTHAVSSRCPKVIWIAWRFGMLFFISTNFLGDDDDDDDDVDDDDDDDDVDDDDEDDDR